MVSENEEKGLNMYPHKFEVTISLLITTICISIW